MNTSTKAAARARPGEIKSMDSIIFSRASNYTKRVSDRVSGTKMSAQSIPMRRRHAMIRMIAVFLADTVEGLPPSSMPGIMYELRITERPKYKQNEERERKIMGCSRFPMIIVPLLMVETIRI